MVSGPGTEVRVKCSDSVPHHLPISLLFRSGTCLHFHTLMAIPKDPALATCSTVSYDICALPTQFGVLMFRGKEHSRNLEVRRVPLGSKL